MNVVIISASPRADAQSARIAARLNEHHFKGQARLLDLHEHKLPEWDGTNFKAESVQRVRALLNEADAFVAVVPEWHGMAPAAFKNLFLWCGHKQFAHKPMLLVAVSAGDGGAFVISELRSSSYKNTRLVHLPEHVILRHVESLWAGEQDTRAAYLEERLDYAVSVLKAYAEALNPVRAALSPELERFANGMS